MRVKRDTDSSRGKGLVKAIAILALVTAAAFCLAFVWQRAQEQSTVQTAPSTSQSPSLPWEEEAAGPSLEEDSQTAEGESVSQDEAFGESSMGEESISPDVQGAVGQPSRAGAVEESPKVDNAYFADAIFFGDSLSTGIPIYQMGGSPDTVAVKGISPFNISTDALATNAQGEKVTVLEAAKAYGPKKKVYIMLGSNGLWMEKDGFVKGYRAFIQSVKEQYPDAVIYLQSMPPVTVKAKETYDTADNNKIRDFNDAIFQLANSTGVNFVDVYSALVDEEGNLPLAASPNDGMHLSPEYYQKWFDYLKTHTVEEKGQ